MVDREYIYVAEAYDKHGNRIERIAHTNRDDAIEDIEVCTAEMDNVVTSVSSLRLYRGKDAIVDPTT